MESPYPVFRRRVPLAIACLAMCASAVAQQSVFPAPRFPNFPAAVTEENLLEASRTFVTRPGGGALPGYSIKRGEKVLLLVTPFYEPPLVNAMLQALREAGASVDVFSADVSDIVGTDRAGIQNWGYLENPIFLYKDSTTKYLNRMELGGGLKPEDLPRLVALKHYDVLIGGAGSTRATSGYRWEEFPWKLGDELLASSKYGLPNEVSRTLYDLAWEQIRHARRVHVTDPEGTDLTWNLPGSIQQIEQTPRFWREYMCHPEILGGKAMESAESTRRVDVTGVIAGTINHVGAFPLIKVHVKHGRIESIEGGGKFGDEWRKILARYDGTAWPGGQPGPGFGWIEECAVGVIPSEVRSRSAMTQPAGTMRERRRSGIFHWAFGSQWSPETAAWFDANSAPDGHFDVHTNFTTMTLTTGDGRTIVFADKGHMTVLDDPRLRAVAAKYGDPDQMLREVWIPPVPGINVQGDYLHDYGSDPAAWIAHEHERFFARPGQSRP